MSTNPQQAMIQIYNDIASLVNDYNELQTDISSKSYQNIDAIKADIEKQQSDLQKLYASLSSDEGGLDPNSNAALALQQVMSTLKGCMIEMTTVVDDLSNGDYADAEQSLANNGQGVISLGVYAYRQCVEWAAAAVQDDINNGASKAQIVQDLTALQAILHSETSGNMAGALGISTTALTSLITAINQAATDAGNPATLQTDWNTILGILDTIPSSPQS